MSPPADEQPIRRRSSDKFKEKFQTIGLLATIAGFLGISFNTYYLTPYRVDSADAHIRELKTETKALDGRQDNLERLMLRMDFRLESIQERLNIDTKKFKDETR